MGIISSFFAFPAFVHAESSVFVHALVDPYSPMRFDYSSVVPTFGIDVVTGSVDQSPNDRSLSGRSPIALTAAAIPETTVSVLHRSYVPGPDETIADVASRYELQESTVRQVNDLTTKSTVQEDTTLLIPPRDGILYMLTKDMSIEDLSAQFDVDRSQIQKYNEVIAGQDVISNEAVVFLPGVDASDYVKKPQYRRYTPVRRSYVARTRTPSSGYETTYGFYRGHCTEWAANRTKELGKDAVTWRGNGGAWAQNASVQGRVVDRNPEVGAIISTKEGWGTGHVAVIEEVHADGSMTISEQNYTGWNMVSTRVIRPDDPRILGIIH